MVSRIGGTATEQIVFGVRGDLHFGALVRTLCRSAMIYIKAIMPPAAIRAGCKPKRRHHFVKSCQVA
jgi:hypothetical protein